MICICNSTNVHVHPSGSTFVPDEYLNTISRAFAVLQKGMHNAKACNDEFKTLPGGRSFGDLLDDHRIWINYDPLNNGALWGWTMPVTHPLDLVITRYALRMGLWSTAATIVHELAHLNGAPGGASHSAEHTVRACGMRSPGGPYDPNVVGKLIRVRDTRIT
jgi:hypothetical protein